MKKAHDFKCAEQIIAINRNNQLMLSKLVEISNGRWMGVPCAPKALPPLTKRGLSTAADNRIKMSVTASRYSCTSASMMTTSKSLNLAVRKKETDRIERENHAFAKRLFDRTSYVQKKAMDTEFK